MTDPTDAPARINRRTRTPQDGTWRELVYPYPEKCHGQRMPRRGEVRRERQPCLNDAKNEHNCGYRSCNIESHIKHDCAGAAAPNPAAGGFV